MEKICSQLEKSQITLIRSYKEIGMKEKDIFSFSHSFCGQKDKKYCLYFGFQLLAYFDTKEELLFKRSLIYNMV